MAARLPFVLALEELVLLAEEGRPLFSFSESLESWDTALRAILDLRVAGAPSGGNAVAVSV